MNISIFGKGFESVREEQERKAQKSYGGKVWDYFLKPNEEAPIRFLTTEPLSFHTHSIQEGNRFKTVVCSGNDCPLCAQGERRGYKSSFLILDLRSGSYRNKQGDMVEFGPQVRVWTTGAGVATVEKLAQRGRINKPILSSRVGEKASTQYLFDASDKEEIKSLYPNIDDRFLADALDENLVRSLLPDDLADKDFYEIIAEHFEVAGEVEQPQKIETSTFENPFPFKRV